MQSFVGCVESVGTRIKYRGNHEPTEAVFSYKQTVNSILSFSGRQNNAADDNSGYGTDDIYLLSKLKQLGFLRPVFMI